MARHTVTAADLIHALGGDLRNGMCRCPCHDDRTPSLHISDVGGKLFWHCHAGLFTGNLARRVSAAWLF
jgi:putative DNA primase/helicase